MVDRVVSTLMLLLTLGMLLLGVVWEADLCGRPMLLGVLLPYLLMLGLLLLLLSLLIACSPGWRRW